MQTVVLGLTGNVAAGKSAVRRLLEKRGATAIDADALVHGLYAPGAPGTAAIVDEFGAELLATDGSVDRAALARLTMGDPAATTRLERAVHPIVSEEIRAWIDEQRGIGAASTGTRIAVVEAALIYEAGVDGLTDRMAVVDAPIDLRRERAAVRGMVADEFAKREARMLAPEAKKARADFVIENDAGPAELQRRVDALVRALLAPRLV